jgi:hypothetical protein
VGPAGRALDHLVGPAPGDLLGSRRFAAWSSVTLVAALTAVAILRRRRRMSDSDPPSPPSPTP